MFEILCALTGLVILFGALYAYARTRDGTHPAIVIAPLLLYSYATGPIFMNWENGLEQYFSAEELIYVAMLYFVTMICFYAGLLSGIGKESKKIRASQNWTFVQSPRVRKRIYTLAIVIGLASVLAYWYMLENVGGFVAAYSKAKGGGHAGSGYIGEATLLSFPAIMLLAIARNGQRIRTGDIALAILFAMPHLLQGTFGGRRGPIFLILCVLFLAWFTAKGRSPSIKEALVGVGVVGLAVLLVWSQRQHMHLGSESATFQSESFMSRVLGENLEEGNTYVAGAGTIIAADIFENFYWGYRYFVTFVVRPIPKQLWPTKYEDMGADWLYHHGDEEREIRYWEALGFRLPGGTATGSIADGYLEFSWGVVVLFFLIGLLYSFVWRRHRADGGFWTVMLVIMLILSIYLATQSVTAWAHRLLYMGAATFLLWRYWLNAPMRTRDPRLRHPMRASPPLTMAPRRG